MRASEEQIADKIPIDAETRKEINKLKDTPIFKTLILEEIFKEVAKDTKEEKEQLASYHRIKAYSKLIKQ